MILMLCSPVTYTTHPFSSSRTVLKVRIFRTHFPNYLLKITTSLCFISLPKLSPLLKHYIINLFTYLLSVCYITLWVPVFYKTPKPRPVLGPKGNHKCELPLPSFFYSLSSLTTIESYLRRYENQSSVFITEGVKPQCCYRNHHTHLLNLHHFCGWSTSFFVSLLLPEPYIHFHAGGKQGGTDCSQNCLPQL